MGYCGDFSLMSICVKFSMSRLCMANGAAENSSVFLQCNLAAARYVGRTHYISPPPLKIQGGSDQCFLKDVCKGASEGTGTFASHTMLGGSDHCFSKTVRQFNSFSIGSLFDLFSFNAPLDYDLRG